MLLQSCPARQALPKPQRHLRALMVGHLRAEKDPLTFLHAAQRLAHRPDIHLDHIGRALDATLGQVRAAEADTRAARGLLAASVTRSSCAAPSRSPPFLCWRRRAGVLFRSLR